jgi:dTDP-L-rhamnose 4-epimerase
MKVLVTGGAGFIGSHVAEAFLRRGREVRLFDNLDPQVHGPSRRWPNFLPDGAEQILGDVRNHEAVAAALRGCDSVIHLAAAVGVGQSMYEVEHYSSVNVVGTAVLLEELIKQREHIRKLIVASSMSIYGEGAYRDMNGRAILPPTRSQDQLAQNRWEMSDGDGRPLRPVPTPESKPLQPGSVYAITKRDQEEMCLSVGRAYSIPTVAFRMFNVYGSRQALSNPYTGVVAIFASRLLNNQAPLIFEDGRQRRDFVHVEDVARAYADALENDNADGMALNLGSGESLSILEIAEAVTRLLKRSVRPVLTSRYREGDIRHCFGDISQAKRMLGWRPNWTFEKGVLSLLAWLQAQDAEDRVEHAYAELNARGLLK